MLNKQLEIIQRINNSFQKAHIEGTYSDTPNNRKLGRVGEKYSESSKSETKEVPTPTSRFFVEATEDTIYNKLHNKGIKGGKQLPPPYVGVSKDGVLWEMFQDKKDGKKGWDVQPTGRKVKQEHLSKFHPETSEEKHKDQIYHPTYSSAVQLAAEKAESQGYTIDDSDWKTQITFGFGKPKNGETRRHTIGLLKDGKESKKSSSYPSLQQRWKW